MANHYLEQKRAAAAVLTETIEKWRTLTPAQQLSALDDRLGKGVGAVKQRARLAKVIAEAAVLAKETAKAKKS